MQLCLDRAEWNITCRRNLLIATSAEVMQRDEKASVLGQPRKRLRQPVTQLEVTERSIDRYRCRSHRRAGVLVVDRELAGTSRPVVGADIHHDAADPRRQSRIAAAILEYAMNPKVY